MILKPRSKPRTHLALIGGALVAVVAAAGAADPPPVFNDESEYDKPIYGPDDTDCDIYGRWTGYGRNARAYGWAVEVARGHMITERGERHLRLDGLKKKHFEHWPEGKIGFYGVPAGCKDECEFVGVVYVVPHVTLNCLLRAEGYRGTREGYVNQDRFSGSVTFAPPP